MILLMWKPTKYHTDHLSEWSADYDWNETDERGQRVGHRFILKHYESPMPREILDLADARGGRWVVEPHQTRDGREHGSARRYFFGSREEAHEWCSEYVTDPVRRNQMRHRYKKKGLKP